MSSETPESINICGSKLVRIGDRNWRFSTVGLSLGIHAYLGIYIAEMKSGPFEATFSDSSLDVVVAKLSKELLTLREVLEQNT